MKQFMKDEIERFRSIMANFPWQSKAAYADWLSQTYYFASETTTLLSLAGSRCAKNSKLQMRFIEHAGEEKGHDKLLLMDLKTIGFTVEDHSELPATSSLFQSQYYWIHERNPEAFFGYIILLEGLASAHGKMMNKLAEDAHGKSATHFLRVHADDDVEHVERAMAELSAFDSSIQDNVRQNFMHAAECYEWMLNSVANRSQRSNLKAG